MFVFQGQPRGQPWANDKQCIEHIHAVLSQHYFRLPVPMSIGIMIDGSLTNEIDYYELIEHNIFNLSRIMQTNSTQLLWYYRLYNFHCSSFHIFQPFFFLFICQSDNPHVICLCDARVYFAQFVPGNMPNKYKASVIPMQYKTQITRTQSTMHIRAQFIAIYCCMWYISTNRLTSSLNGP